MIAWVLLLSWITLFHGFPGQLVEIPVSLLYVFTPAPRYTERDSKLTGEGVTAMISDSMSMPSNDSILGIFSSWQS